MVNHKWNVLKALRFYNRIGKPFTVETYFHFHSAPVKREKIFDEVRTHVRAKRIKTTAGELLLTEKGMRDLQTWEQNTIVENRERRSQNYIAKGKARPNTRTSTGQYADDED